MLLLNVFILYVPPLRPLAFSCVTTPMCLPITVHRIIITPPPRPYIFLSGMAAVQIA